MRKRISDCLDNHPEGITADAISDITGIPPNQVRSILSNRRSWGEVEVLYRNARRDAR